MSNFLMVILALTALIGAGLIFKVAVNMGNKIKLVNDILEIKSQAGSSPGKKHSSGAARNFVPSHFS